MGAEKHLSRKQKIYDDLAGRIKNGEWAYGKKLPAMSKFCAEYKVSMITMVSAMRQLEKDGMVQQKRGSGTYVKWKEEDIYYSFFVKDNRRRPIAITYSLLNASPLYLLIMKQLADFFMKIHTDTNIEFINLSYQNNLDDPYIQKITNGNMPVCGEFFWHAMYAKLDALLPLEKLPGFDGLKASIIPQALYPTANGSGESRIHAIYLYLGLPSFILLNEKWIRELNMEIQEKTLSWPQIFRLLRHARQLRRKNTFAGALPLPHAWHGIKYYLEIMGQDVLSKSYDPNSGKSIYDIIFSDSAQKALCYLEKFITTVPGGIKLDKGDEYFALGKVGILPFSSSWSLQLQETLNHGMPIMPCEFPGLDAGKAYRPFYSGFSVGIFRDGISSEEQLLAAWNWLKFLFCTHSQEIASQAMNLLVREDAVPHLAVTNPNVYQSMKQVLKRAVPQPDFVGMRRVFSSLSSPLRLFLTQKDTAEQCLSKMRAAIEQSLNKGNC